MKAKPLHFDESIWLWMSDSVYGDRDFKRAILPAGMFNLLLSKNSPAMAGYQEYASEDEAMADHKQAKKRYDQAWRVR